MRLAGIEPTTPWFVAKYSIQLSYSRIGGEGGTTVPNSENRCKSTACVAVAVEIPLLALLLAAVCPDYNTVLGVADKRAKQGKHPLGMTGNKRPSC